MSRLGSLAEIGPGKSDLRRAVAMIVGFGAQDHQVGRFLAPGKAGVDGCGGIENTYRSGVNVENLDSVASFILRVDGHSEESAGFGKVLPGVFRNVAEGSVAPRGELAEKQGSARGSFVRVRGIRRIFFLGLLLFGWRATHRQPGTVRAEGE